MGRHGTREEQRDYELLLSGPQDADAVADAESRWGSSADMDQALESLVSTLSERARQAMTAEDYGPLTAAAFIFHTSGTPFARAPHADIIRLVMEASTTPAALRQQYEHLMHAREQTMGSFAKDHPDLAKKLDETVDRALMLAKPLADNPDAARRTKAGLAGGGKRKRKQKRGKRRQQPRARCVHHACDTDRANNSFLCRQCDLYMHAHQVDGDTMDWRDGDDGLFETYIDYAFMSYAQVYGDQEGGWTQERVPRPDNPDDECPAGRWDRREPHAHPGRANRFWPEINGIDTNGDKWHPHFGDTRGWTNPATPAQYDQYCRDQREAERTRQAALDNPIVPCHGCSSYAGNTSSEGDSSGAPSDDDGGDGKGGPPGGHTDPRVCPVVNDTKSGDGRTSPRYGIKTGDGLTGPTTGGAGDGTQAAALARPHRATTGPLTQAASERARLEQAQRLSRWSPPRRRSGGRRSSLGGVDDPLRLGIRQLQRAYAATGDGDAHPSGAFDAADIGDPSIIGPPGSSALHSSDSDSLGRFTVGEETLDLISPASIAGADSRRTTTDASSITLGDASAADSRTAISDDLTDASIKRSSSSRRAARMAYIAAATAAGGSESMGLALFDEARKMGMISVSLHTVALASTGPVSDYGSPRPEASTLDDLPLDASALWRSQRRTGTRTAADRGSPTMGSESSCGRRGSSSSRQGGCTRPHSRAACGQHGRPSDGFPWLAPCPRPRHGVGTRPRHRALPGRAGAEYGNCRQG